MIFNAFFSGMYRSCRDIIKSLSISSCPPTTVYELEAQLKKATLHVCYATDFFIDIGKIWIIRSLISKDIIHPTSSDRTLLWTSYELMSHVSYTSIHLLSYEQPNNKRVGSWMFCQSANSKCAVWASGNESRITLKIPGRRIKNSPTDFPSCDRQVICLLFLLYFFVDSDATELKNVCACVQLTLSGAFSLVWSMKVHSFEQCCSLGWFPGDYHFWQFAWTDGNVASESQHNTVNISVNTSCVEVCTKTSFSEVVHPLNFSKNNFPLLKPNSYLFTAEVVFSL